MFQTLNPNSLPIARVVFVWPSSYQDTKTCISHMPVMLVEAFNRLLQFHQHHHALFPSTLAPSYTKYQSFDQFLPLKTLFAALYATVLKIGTYVHSFRCFFHIWRALYAEKILISTWAKMHKYGWLKK